MLSLLSLSGWKIPLFFLMPLTEQYPHYCVPTLLCTHTVVGVQHIPFTFMCVITICERVVFTGQHFANMWTLCCAKCNKHNLKTKVRSQVQSISMSYRDNWMHLWYFSQHVLPLLCIITLTHINKAMSNVIICMHIWCMWGNRVIHLIHSY